MKTVLPVVRFFGPHVLGKHIRSTSSDEPLLSIRAKKKQRSCFVILNGKLKNRHRVRDQSGESPRFGQVFVRFAVGFLPVRRSSHGFACRFGTPSKLRGSRRSSCFIT